MEKKTVIWVSAIALTVTATGFFLGRQTANAASPVTDNASYALTAAVVGEGQGAVAVELGEVFRYYASVDAPFVDSVYVAVPAQFGEKFTPHDTELHARLLGKVVTATGEVKGHVTVNLHTPFGVLTVYDKDFDLTSQKTE
jgi:hypothetical protein